MRAAVGALVALLLTLTLSGCVNAPVEPPSPAGAAQESTVAPLYGRPLAMERLRVVHDTGKVSGPLATSCKATSDGRPDAVCDPGSVRDDVTELTKAQTICKAGWTSTVRADTEKAKTAEMRAYGVPESQRKITEYDHIVSLQLGGSNATDNLWPQVSDLPGSGFANTKDAVENKLNDAVCDGRVNLVDAQVAIARNWRTALARFNLK